MPFRLGEGRAKIQFTTSAEMPALIYRACLATGMVSNTVYCQHAIVDALARDLGLDRDELLAHLPAPRGPANHLYDPDEHTMDRFRHRHLTIVLDQSGGVVRTGPANTREEIK